MIFDTGSIIIILAIIIIAYYVISILWKGRNKKVKGYHVVEKDIDAENRFIVIEVSNKGEKPFNDKPWTEKEVVDFMNSMAKDVDNK